MVQRRYKVTAATIVLLLGVCLAWPLRRSAAPVESRIVLPAASGNQAAALAPLADSPVSDYAAVIPAQTASLMFSEPPPENASFEAQSPVTPFEPPAVEGGPRPVYLSPANGAADLGIADSLAGAPATRVHVVHNGDTLTRLAKRYLGDEGRALEIFDLNRDQLANPHLLPIGAELRIPGSATED